MSIFSSLYTGMSGMRVNETGIAVTGDNIANMNTIGFKASRPVFADILNATVMGSPGSANVGQGALAQAVQRIQGQGAMLQTGVTSDLAIGGNGFFICRGELAGQDSRFYTRNGQFRIDDEGFMATVSGLRLQGFMAEPPNGPLKTAISDLSVGQAVSEPVATTTLDFTVNLDPNEDVVGPGATLNTTVAANGAEEVDTSNVAFSTSVTVYDSLGNTHPMEVYFIHQAPGEWTWHAMVDGESLEGGNVGAVPGVADTPTLAGEGVLNFNTEGLLDSEGNPGVGDITLNVNFAGASPQDIVVDFGNSITDEVGDGSGSSSFNGGSSVNGVSQNGFGPGALTFINFEPDGTIIGVFDNGDERILAKLALADFRAPDELSSIGGNLFLQSPHSGEPVIGFPNQGGRGQIYGGALEQSNVDLSNEFTQMIINQRGFQASSRTVTTADQMLTELINLKR